jgi:hypothetical protein
MLVDPRGFKYSSACDVRGSSAPSPSATRISVTSPGAAQADLDLAAARCAYEAADSAYQRVTYPYTERTFAVSLPAARDTIRAALTEVNAATPALLGEEQPATASDPTGTGAVVDRIGYMVRELELAEETLTLGRGEAVFGDVEAGGARQLYSSIWNLHDLARSRDEARLRIDRTGVLVTEAKEQVAQSSPRSGVSLRQSEATGNIGIYSDGTPSML